MGAGGSWRTSWVLCWDAAPGAVAYELRTVTGEGTSPKLRRQTDRCLRIEAAAGDGPAEERPARRAAQLAGQQGQLAFQVRSVPAHGPAGEWSPAGGRRLRGPGRRRLSRQARSRSASADAGVDGQVPGGGGLPGEPAGHPGAGGAEAVPQRPVVDQRPHGAGQRRRVGRRHEQRVDPGGEVLAEHGDVGGHDRQAGGHGLQHGQAPALLDRRERQGVGGPVPGGELAVGDRAEQHDVAPQLQAERRHAAQRRLPVLPVVLEGVAADDRQHRARVDLGLQPAQRLDEVDAALAGLDPADGQEQEPVLGPDLPAERRPAARHRSARSAAGRRRCRPRRRRPRTRPSAACASAG